MLAFYFGHFYFEGKDFHMKGRDKLSGFIRGLAGLIHFYLWYLRDLSDHSVHTTFCSPFCSWNHYLVLSDSRVFH